MMKNIIMMIEKHCCKEEWYNNDNNNNNNNNNINNKLLWDFPIQTVHKIEHNRPNITKRACPFDHWVSHKEKEKIEKYQESRSACGIVRKLYFYQFWYPRNSK